MTVYLTAPSAQSVPTKSHLVDRHDHLEQDQEHDNHFEPQRAPGVDDIGQHLRGLGDHGELAVERFRALLQFVLVLQPRIQPLEFRLVPENVRLFRDCDGSGYPVTHRQCVADVLEDRPAATADPPALRQFPRKRLGGVEYGSHLALVPGKDDALGQHFRDQDQPLRREALQADRTARRDRLVLLSGQFDDGNFLIAPLERPGHARLQAAQEVVLTDGVEADENDDAVAKQHSHAFFIDAKRQWRRCQHIAALEARRIEPIADGKRPDGRPGAAKRRFGGLVHQLRIPAELAISPMHFRLSPLDIVRATLAWTGTGADIRSRPC